MLFLADNEGSGRASLVKVLDRIKVGATRNVDFYYDYFFLEMGGRNLEGNARTLCVDLLELVGFFFFLHHLSLRHLSHGTCIKFLEPGGAWETDSRERHERMGR